RRTIPDVRFRELERTRGERRARLDRTGEPGRARTASDSPRGVRSRAEAPCSLQPLQHLRARRQYVPILRSAFRALRAEPRSRGAAIPGRACFLGERRLL